MKRVICFKPPATLMEGTAHEDQGKLVRWGTAITTFSFEKCLYVTGVGPSEFKEGIIYNHTEGYLPEGKTSVRVPHLTDEHRAYFPLYFPELGTHAVWLNPAVGTQVLPKFQAVVCGVWIIATDQDAKQGLPRSIEFR